MGRHQVHYEVFARKTPQASWVLEQALESREQAMQMAEDMLAGNKAAAVRVTKEVFDTESGEFTSAAVLNKGISEPVKKLKLAPETDTVCVSPQDLYNGPAREKMSRLLEDWLRMQRITPFELLHRPDIAEKLEASGQELLHVAQKLAVPESHDTGQDLHDLIRRWTKLFDRATTRLIQDGRKKLFPELTPANWLGLIDKLKDHPERAYVLGGGVAGLLAAEHRPSAKLEILLGLANQLADDLGGREWALHLIEAPVVEIFAMRNALNDILGEEVDLGTSMAIMTRMAAGIEVEKIARHDARVAHLVPPLTGTLGGYHDLIIKGLFPQLSYHISKRLMQDLKGPRRLRPNDPEAEIETLRVLAICMAAAGRDETQREDITEAFVERSKKLVSADFVGSLLQKAETPVAEVEKLIWLCENMVGSANKRQAASWLQSVVGAAKFERYIRDSSTSAAQRLLILAQMQRKIITVQLADKDAADINAKLGQIGAVVASDVKLLAHILHASAPAFQKISMLLSFAIGQSAPLGPISDQAKAEVMKLLRLPETRQSLMAQPQNLAILRPMMQAAGLAA